MIWISFLPACEEHSVGGVDPPQTEKKVPLVPIFLDFIYLLEKG